MNDEIDLMEEKFCAILSAISNMPRKKCDEFFTLVDHGAMPIEEFDAQIRMEFGHDNIEKVKGIMRVVNSSGQAYEVTI